MSCYFCDLINSAELGVKILNPKATVPSKTPEDSGYDIYGIFEDEEFVLLRPQENVIINTGISVEFPQGLGMIIKNRSSVGIKCAVVGAELVDSGYRGEIHIDLHNIGDSLIFITDLTKDQLKERAEEIFDRYMDKFQKTEQAMEYVKTLIDKPDTKFLHSKNAIVQAVIVPTLNLPVVVKNILTQSSREDGKFGSSNKHKL